MGRFFDEIAKVVGGGVSRRGALRKIGGALLAAVGLGGFARRASADTLAACNAYCAGRGFTAGSAFIQCRNACLPCPTTAQLCGATAATLTCCPTPANSTVNCVNNACAVTACANGFRNCDNSVANGCETNVTNNNANCGACGTVCPNGTTCQNSVCVSNSMCGNGTVDAGEERDPAPGPFTNVTVDATTCRWHFETVPQLYCNGSCTWAGGASCDQADADIFCKLRTGNPNSVATSFQITTALAQHGFSCVNLGYGTNLGHLPLRGVNRDVGYQDSSILANHGAGLVIVNPVCT